ncbi:substrate-binding domain-containing protein [Engelhardtia mirabilis]
MDSDRPDRTASAVACAGSAPPRTGRSVLLALSWYDPRVHRGVARYAAERGWRLDARMANSREPVWGWQGDGVLCKLGCTAVDEQVAQLVASLGLPAVDLSVFGPHHGVTAIEFDPDHIGALAADHLLARGIRHLAFFPDLDAPPVRLRREGFARALAERGLGLLDLAPVQTDQVDGWIAAEEELGRRLAELPRPVGVLCFNDTWGAQVVHAAGRAGLRCPEDVAVLGVDNQALACEALPVPLSSVALDLEAWGERAAARLDALMGARERGERPTEPSLERLAVGTVVARRSTDLVAVAHRDVAAAVAFIAQHLADPVRVDAVVAAGRLSRSGLKQAFARHLGRSIQGEIERARLERIRGLLLSTDWSLETIAGEVGLSSARSVHRLFTRGGEAGPAEFRRRYKG